MTVEATRPETETVRRLAIGGGGVALSGTGGPDSTGFPGRSRPDTHNYAMGLLPRPSACPRHNMFMIRGHEGHKAVYCPV